MDRLATMDGRGLREPSIPESPRRFDSSRRSGRGCHLLLSLLLISVLGAIRASAAVTDVTIADVTARAFAVVWLSDEPVLDAGLRVFADAGGTTELTGGLTVTLASGSDPAAHGLGVVKMKVSGLSPDTQVYIQTETTTAGGAVQVPSAPPYIEVVTAVEAMPAAITGEPVANDVVVHEVFAEDGTTPGTGALVIVEAPGLAPSAVSAFAGEGVYVPEPGAGEGALNLPGTLIDLNNLFDFAGVTVQLPEESILRITEFRGALCTSLEDHRRVRFRRLPPPAGPTLTELATPVPCFFADTVCDDVVDILDVQWVLNRFGRLAGDCGFHPDLDLVADDAIDILDVQSVLDRFGESAPFSP